MIIHHAYGSKVGLGDSWTIAIIATCGVSNVVDQWSTNGGPSTTKLSLVRPAGLYSTKERWYKTYMIKQAKKKSVVKIDMELELKAARAFLETLSATGDRQKAINARLVVMGLGWATC